VLSIVLLLRTEKGEELRMLPNVSESVLNRLCRSAMFVRLWTSRCRGTSSDMREMRVDESAAEERRAGELVSLLYAMFLPE
jgi:hypothetical protein